MRLPLAALLRCGLCLAIVFGSAIAFSATPPMQLYDQVQRISTTANTIHVENLALKRDRLEFTFTGDFRVTTAV